ncbi:MAG TPA: hypothetical protein VGF69_12210 [Thermoanaerobaculia bacterium]
MTVPQLIAAVRRAPPALLPLAFALFFLLFHGVWILGSHEAPEGHAALGRDTASELISRHEQFREKRVVRLRGSEGNTVLRKMVELGWARTTSNSFVITATGREALFDDLSEGGGEYRIAIARRKLLDVENYSEARTIAGDGILLEFTWCWEPINQLGETVLGDSPEPRPGAAELRPDGESWAAGRLSFE